ncbi:MAG: hypothetical protein J0L87_04580, partial [Bacteroidetes bacterium]|nr:hypothetical protein [Bacteroidota bacterium]
MKNINYFVLAILSIVSLDALSQRGIDGTPTISAANTIVNEYTTLTADAAVGATTISVAASGLNANNRFGAGNSLAAGDLIMIIQMQGASSSSTFSAEFPAGSGEFYGFPNDKTWGVVTGYNNCGNYEFAEVKSVPSTTSIELVCGLTYGYTTSGRTQVIRVPRYAALTLSGAGTISGQAWAATGNTGGVVAIEVLGNVAINNVGGITANSLGFRGGSVTGDNNSGLGGGQVARNNNNEGSEKGEGIFGYQADYNVFGGRYCRGAAGNAGGGGDAHNSGGGGGANAGNPATPWDGEGNPDISTASWATAWNLESAGFSTHVSSGGGRGGYSFSDQNADALVVGPRPFQSGATNAWGGDYRTNNGGWGGRPLDYSTGKLFIGGGGGAGDRNNSSAGNGGRGGGLVYLMCYGTVSGTGSVTANGANGGGSGADGAGGGGGGGTIVLNAVGTISGISASATGGTGGSQTINNSTTSETEGPGGGGGGGYIAVSNGAIVQTVTGGMNGTTNANQLSEFPPNGATRGGAGLSNQAITNFTIAASDVTICSGNTATLTVTASGTVPSPITYNWYTTQTGGNPVGTGASFTTPVLGATTTYYVGTCPGTYRIPVVVTVTGSVPASVAVAASATTICVGQSVTFTATPTNGGTPTYQWQVNGGNVGTNSSTFTSTTLNNGDVVTVIMTSSLGCASGSPATSNSVTMTVNAAGAASVSVAASATTICSGSSVTFTATPTNGGATPSYQWQVNGSNVGTNSPTFTSTTLTNGQTVTVIMTSSSTCATGSPATSNSVVMTVNSSVVPSVSIAASATTICSGSSVTFTATPTNGGTTPSYQWQVNGSNVGTNSATFTSSTLNNGDAVTVIMTSSNACASPASATSNSISMTVNPVVIPAVSIVASATAICTGASVTFTATPTNGGTTPSYQWQVNGSNVGTNATTFTSTGLNNGDVVTVILTSNAACASPATATSNSITMTVNTTLVPSVSIAASTTTICAGASVTFTAIPTNGGSSPVYQWQVNGGNVGTNSATFTTTTLNNGDVVTVILTSSDACAAPTTATSNSITMSVGATVAPSVSIAASATTICSGTSVTFTATPTNGGSTPSYQWQVNGTNAGANSDTFTSTTLANGDVVTVILTSNLSCASPVTATSNAINITVNASVTPSVSISASSTTICSGSSVTFTATPTNGGTTPSY